MLTFEEWKEEQYGKDYQATYDEKGVCDGTCDSCLRHQYAYEYVLNFSENL